MSDHHRCTPVCARPTLGTYLARPDVADRIATARWAARRRMLDARARIRLGRDLVDVQVAVDAGRRLDLVAHDLRTIADVCDLVVQTRTPVGRAALRDVA